nr:zinc finger, CCHC-type [Tanacetum cinerariifolium]
MHPGKSQSEHIDEFHKLVGDLAAIDTAILDKDQALLLLTSLYSSYDNFVKTLLYSRDTLKLEDVLATLHSRELQKMTEAKGDGGEGLYVKRRFGQRDMKQGTYSAWSKSQGRRRRLRCFICQYEEHLKRDYTRYNHKKSQGFVNAQVFGYGADGECRVRGTCKVQVQMRDGSSFVLDNVSEKYKKTFIGSDVCTGSVQVLQGVEFEVKSQEDHTFEVEPHGNIDHVVGSQDIQTYDLIYYHPVRDREQHSSWELFNYREDIACEVISKWKVGLKDDMDVRSYVYVLSNGCRKCNDDSDGYYLTMLGGHSILSLKDSLSGDCDVKHNGKWSCIYAVESYEYQVVCTRLDIASADVGMLDKFDRGLQTDVQVFVDFDYSMAGYMTLTEAVKEAIWLKRLVIESGFELKIVASIATIALSKDIPGPRFQHRMNDLLDDNNFFIVDDVNVRISPVSKMPFRKKPCDSMH